MSLRNRISNEERFYIKESIKYDIRTDGRKNQDFREIRIRNEVIKHLYASSKASIGTSIVLASASLKIGEPLPGYPEFGVVEINVNPLNNESFSASHTKKFSWYNRISNILQMAYASPEVIDLKSLCVLPGFKCWVLNIDVLVIEDSGNLLDVAGIAVNSCLETLKIPSVEIVEDSCVVEEIEINADVSQSVPLKTFGLPLVITAYFIDNVFIFDPTFVEEMCANNFVSVAICPNNKKISMVYSDGCGSIKKSTMDGLLEVIKSKSGDVSARISENSESSQSDEPFTELL